MSLFQYPSYLRKEYIEQAADNLLEQMREDPCYKVTFPLDPTRVAEFLDLDVVWDTIPSDEKGKIAARILPLKKLIEINDSIPDLRGAFGNSTIAHEIGHWILHINHDEVNGAISQQTLDLFSDMHQPFLCRSMTAQQGIEWQAQYFASCLMMPVSVLKEVGHGRDLTNWRHLYPMANDLDVTISNLTNRLQDLGLIRIQRGSKRIYPGHRSQASQPSLLS